MKKYLLITLVGLSLSAPCQAQEWNAVAKASDLLIWRPLSFAWTITGGALWVASLPVTLPSNSQKDALDVMVKTPYQWTFERPLVDISE